MLPMKCVVTGAAGFIGSHLSAELLRLGHDVVGIDAFIPYYPRAIKERNQAELLRNPRYRFVELDLRHGRVDPQLDALRRLPDLQPSGHAKIVRNRSANRGPPRAISLCFYLLGLRGV